MRLLIFGIVLIMVSSIISSCKGELEEGDRNSYTWKGHIYKGYSDEPLANERVYLESEKVNINNNSTYEVIGETTTDENGYYSITYKNVGLGTSTVRLYSSNPLYDAFPLYVAGMNENVDKDIATYDHVRVELNINVSNPNNDTLYLAPYSLLQNEGGTRVDEEFNENASGKYIRIISSEKSYNTFLKGGVGGRYVNSGQAVWTIIYGFGRRDFFNAMNTPFLDSVPDHYNFLKFDLEGFPAIDTINIDL